MDFTPYLGAGGVVALFGACSILLVQIMRQTTSLNRSREAELSDMKTQIGDLQAENLVCAWRVNALITVVRDHGLTVPDDIFRAKGPA